MSVLHGFKCQCAAPVSMWDTDSENDRVVHLNADILHSNSFFETETETFEMVIPYLRKGITVVETLRRGLFSSLEQRSFV